MFFWVLLLAELTSDVVKKFGFTEEVLDLTFFMFVYSFIFLHRCTFLAVVR